MKSMNNTDRNIALSQSKIFCRGIFIIHATKSYSIKYFVEEFSYYICNKIVFDKIFCRGIFIIYATKSYSIKYFVEEFSLYMQQNCIR